MLGVRPGLSAVPLLTLVPEAQVGVGVCDSRSLLSQPHGPRCLTNSLLLFIHGCAGSSLLGTGFLWFG